MAGYYRERIGIVDVIRDTFSLLQKNFKFLICIALIGSVIPLAESTYAFLFNEEISGITNYLLWAANVFVFVWVHTALILSIASSYYGDQNSFTEIKKVTSGKYWSVFVATLKLGFILLIPASLVFLPLAIPSGTILFLLVGCSLLLYLYIKYLFVLPGVVLERNQISAFQDSSRMVQGRFWKIAGVMLVLDIVFLVVPLIYGFSIVDVWAEWSAGRILLHNVVLVVLNMAYQIIQTTLITLLYLKLKELDAGLGGHHESEI